MSRYSFRLGHKDDFLIDTDAVMELLDRESKGLKGWIVVEFNDVERGFNYYSLINKDDKSRQFYSLFGGKKYFE